MWECKEKILFYSLEMSVWKQARWSLELREDEVRAGDIHFVIMHL